MKANLGCGQNIIEGPDCKNIDLKPFNDKVIQGDMRNLSNLDIEDGSLDQIWSTQSLQCIKVQEIGQCLKHWVDKLQTGGLLYIESLDSKLFGQELSNQSMQPEAYNELLFGNGSNLGLYDLVTIEGFLKQLGMQTVEKGYKNIFFYLQMVKS